MNQISTDSGIEDSATREAAIRLDREVRGRILDLERRVTQLTAQLASLDAENEMNRARMRAVRTSLSWRITRPLRRARRFVARPSDGDK